MGSYQVRLPSYVKVSKGTTKGLNLNIYRNLHHHHLNTQKKNFHGAVKKLLDHIPHMDKIMIHYEVFAPRNNRMDTMNVASIVDKYFSDTLVEAGKIPDDNNKHVVHVSSSFGGVIPMEGYVLATIYEVEKEPPMRVLLDNNDIQTALEAHVETLGLAGATGVELTVNASGEVEAEVLFGEAPVAAPAPKKAPAKRRSPAKKKAEPVEETADAGEDTEAGGDGTDTGGSESAEETPEAAPETKTEKAEAPASKNLFSDSEQPQSSESGETGETGKADDTPVEPKKKKSSIFDVG